MKEARTLSNGKVAVDKLGDLSCEDVAWLIPDHYTHNLDEATKAKVEAHFAVCLKCKLERVGLALGMDIEMDRRGLREEIEQQRKSIEEKKKQNQK